VGAAVTRHAVGDRVGVGCMVDSCRECENCLAGEEQYCLKGNVPTYNGIGKDGRPTDGGYSTHIVVDEDFVLNVPDGVDLDVAAPLLCAGITLYSPLRHWGAGPGKQVAIVGLGGLGHMGVKLAHALGAEVTVLSQTLAKEGDGRRLSADHYHATSDPGTFKQLRGRFDLIINTVSATLPIDAYLSLLRLDGALVNVGAPFDPLEVRVFSLLNNRRSFAGSAIGGIRETQEMLDFCAQHGLGADIEVIGADQIDRAYDRVVDSDVRYRFVIDTATF
jgi:alcohol dehydrogenase (NADP+)